MLFLRAASADSVSSAELTLQDIAGNAALSALSGGGSQWADICLIRGSETGTQTLLLIHLNLFPVSFSQARFQLYRSREAGARDRGGAGGCPRRR